MKEKVNVYVLYDVDGNIGDNTIMHGTINDIRTWAKNLWKQDQDWAKETMSDVTSDEVENEEEFYSLLDVDSLLVQFLDSMSYQMIELCEVPFDDFYDDKKPTQELIDEVMFQIKVDIAEGDLTALDEMLKAMPIQQLVSYLPEK
jgi:hypothetical protein